MLKYFKIFQYAARNRIVYYFDILFRNIFFLILLYIFYRLWYILDQKGKLTSHYEYSQLVWYFIITESLLSSFATLRGVVDEEIQTGKIVQILIRPYNYILYHLSEYLGKTLIMFLNNLILGFLFGTIVAGPLPPNPINLLAIIPIFLSAILINFFVEFAIALTAFWTENSVPFFWIYHKIVFILGGLLIPIDYYPQTLRLICSYMPFQYILYMPAKLFVDFSMAESYRIFITQSLWVILILISVTICFKIGVRKVCIHGG